MLLFMGGDYARRRPLSIPEDDFVCRVKYGQKKVSEIVDTQARRPYRPHMKTTLQEFKSKLTVGARCLFTARWCPTPTIRTVTVAQSKKAAFTHPTKSGDSWLDFPTAAEITQDVPNVFVIRHHDCPDNPLTYDFRPESTGTIERRTP